MRIVNNPVEDFGGFELDAGAVELHSAKKENIMLPYRGPLPKQMSPASRAYIQITAQPVQGVKCVLVVDLDGGKRLRRPLEAPNEQVMGLLDRFFAQDTGLDNRQLGFEEGNYFNWRLLATDFKWLGKMADRLTPQQKSWLLKRLEE